MTDETRRQIYKELSLRDTEDLVEIWRANDRVEWRDETFEVIQEILQERLGEIPPQDEWGFEHNEEGPEQDDNPIFYRPQEVFWVEKWSSRAAVAAVIILFITCLPQLDNLHRSVWFFWGAAPEWNFTAWVITGVVYILATALESIILYLPLRALGPILRVS